MSGRFDVEFVKKIRTKTLTFLASYNVLPLQIKIELSQ